MDVREKIILLSEQTLTSMGFEIVRVLVSGKTRPVLQMIIDRLDGQNISVDDCVEVSRTLSAILDVEDPIQGAYMLEVSSPGPERPLTKLLHFQRFIGHIVRLEASQLLNGRKRFQGVIQATTDAEHVCLKVQGLKAQDKMSSEGEGALEEGALVNIPFALIAKATLHPEMGQPLKGAKAYEESSNRGRHKRKKANGEVVP